ncbi:hypothetical protein EDD22DRAFT_851418 [Suillus occidentalis]|nr:hypothetical protein EDD22DRAFT_851418 [Suillus occidentalis]
MKRAPMHPEVAQGWRNEEAWCPVRSPPGSSLVALVPHKEESSADSPLEASVSHGEYLHDLEPSSEAGEWGGLTPHAEEARRPSRIPNSRGPEFAPEWGGEWIDKDRLSLAMTIPLVSSYGIVSPLGQRKVVAQRPPGKPVRTRRTSFGAAS